MGGYGRGKEVLPAPVRGAKVAHHFITIRRAFGAPQHVLRKDGNRMSQRAARFGATPTLGVLYRVAARPATRSSRHLASIS